MINVYEYIGSSDVVARVEYNEDLDSYDGHNFTNGGVGRHKGITRLKNGEYVVIIGTQWQGERNYAYIVSEKGALNEILDSGHDELLDSRRFLDLKKYAEEQGFLGNSEY